MTFSKQVLSAVTIGLLACSASSVAGQKVSVDDFVRAETDMTMRRYEAQGGFGKFLHVRQPTPLDKQNVIRMNRDTLYSRIEDIDAPFLTRGLPSVMDTSSG